METKLKINKKEGTFKLTLPEGNTCVMICINKSTGLVPLRVESGANVKVEEIKALLVDPEVTQVVLIPINYNEYIHVLKEPRRILCETLPEFQES